MTVNGPTVALDALVPGDTFAVAGQNDVYVVLDPGAVFTPAAGQIAAASLGAGSLKTFNHDSGVYKTAFKAVAQ